MSVLYNFHFIFHWNAKELVDNRSGHISKVYTHFPEKVNQLVNTYHIISSRHEIICFFMDLSNNVSTTFLFIFSLFLSQIKLFPSFFPSLPHMAPVSYYFPPPPPCDHFFHLLVLKVPHVEERLFKRLVFGKHFRFRPR